MTNFEGSNELGPPKKSCKEKTKAHEKEMFLKKLVVQKDKKGFDVVEC
jgi:hypothetical protein